MPKSNNQNKSKFAQLLDPLRVVIILAIFAVPIAVALNLTAGTREVKRILGVKSYKGVSIEEIKGEHNYFTRQKLSHSSNIFIFSGQVGERESGVYSKPVVKFENQSLEGKSLKLYGRIEGKSYSKLSLIFKEESGKIEDIEYVIDYKESENSYLVDLPANYNYTVYLKVENEDDILYSQNIKINFMILDEE